MVPLAFEKFRPYHPAISRIQSYVDSRYRIGQERIIGSFMEEREIEVSEQLGLDFGDSRVWALKWKDFDHMVLTPLHWLKHEIFYENERKISAWKINHSIMKDRSTKIYLKYYLFICLTLICVGIRRCNLCVIHLVYIYVLLLLKIIKRFYFWGSIN